MSEANSILGNTTGFASARREFTEKYGFTALRFYLQAVARDLLPNERINICWRHMLPARSTVDVIYSDERQRARAAGTMKCGNPWYCPVCIAYISERRRLELQLALERSRDKYFAVMVTYTIRHGMGDNLGDLMSNMQNAYRKMKSGRTWQNTKSEWFMIGSVRATEITWGDSGWHPHYHELLFADIDQLRTVLEGDLSEYTESLKNQLTQLWRDALMLNGLEASIERGVTVRSTNKDVSEYVIKYGKMPLEAIEGDLSTEIANSAQKRARGANLSVYDLLFAAGEGNRQAKRLFLDFAQYTKKRHPLQWSRGFKSLFDIDSIRDEIAAQGIETGSDRLLAAIPAAMWRFITSQGFTGQLMTIANTGSLEKMQWFVSKMQEKMPDVVTVDFAGF